jgi:hypothetical protein
VSSSVSGCPSRFSHSRERSHFGGTAVQLLHPISALKNRSRFEAASRPSKLALVGICLARSNCVRVPAPYPTGYQQAWRGIRPGLLPSSPCSGPTRRGCFAPAMSCDRVRRPRSIPRRRRRSWRRSSTPAHVRHQRGGKLLADTEGHHDALDTGGRSEDLRVPAGHQSAPSRARAGPDERRDLAD